MNQCKEPKGAQRYVLANNKLNMRNWLVVDETETHLVVCYRYGSFIKRLDKRTDLWSNKKAPVM